MRESTVKLKEENMTLINELSVIYKNISMLVTTYLRLDNRTDTISATQHSLEDAIYTESDTFHTKYVKILNRMRVMYDDIFQYSDDCAMNPTPSTIDMDVECYTNFSTDLTAFSDICGELSEIVGSFSNTLKTFAENRPTEEDA